MEATGSFTVDYLHPATGAYADRPRMEWGRVRTSAGATDAPARQCSSSPVTNAAEYGPASAGGDCPARR
jgi:hypothetical protein